MLYHYVCNLVSCLLHFRKWLNLKPKRGSLRRWIGRHLASKFVIDTHAHATYTQKHKNTHINTQCVCVCVCARALAYYYYLVTSPQCCAYTCIDIVLVEISNHVNIRTYSAPMCYYNSNSNNIFIVFMHRLLQSLVDKGMVNVKTVQLPFKSVSVVCV